MSLCPCCSGREAASCCAPLLAGKEVATTAEALMRSRYTAFVQGNLDYIEQTSAPEALEEFDRDEFARVLSGTTWLGLDVLRTEAGGERDETGQVEFAFHCKYGGEQYTQHELSTFRRENGQWFYVSSDNGPKEEPARVNKVGRNDPCACGSGKKHKKCCGA